MRSVLNKKGRVSMYLHRLLSMPKMFFGRKGGGVGGWGAEVLRNVFRQKRSILAADVVPPSAQLL